ncbi:MAG: Sodium-dependent dicarboxylate transporter SdcS [Alphaproteobacteria bacterium MarineAlpha9_Bin4]|nr:anion transporter [Pelagibacterales bacterium]PPR27361.1 MAG: Sodium-dependent dicarboxylate transporter SdcS [Alphaproteobacteria bacterium MarineAlpha9_Bin4]
MFKKTNISLLGLSFGVLVFLFFYISSPPEGLNRISWLTAGVTILMTIWWISEAIPIYVTGLIPLILFPLFDLFELKEVATSYAHPLVLLFLGGFIIASAMEDSGLHKRIAIKILSFSGTSPSKIIAGFMITTALLSMWVSNTASTIMMLPIATSVIAFFSSQKNINNKSFAIPLLLSIAYSASIGGTATLIGTPTNIMLASILSDSYNFQISFIDWFMIGLPIAIILIPIVWFFLNKVIYKVSSKKSDALENTLLNMKSEIGKASTTEKVVAIIFFFTASLWIFRKALNENFGLTLNDTSIGILGALLLFIIPCGPNKRACNWKTANQIPWGVLFLVGGGIALSRAIKDSGLAEWIGSFSNYLYGLDIYILILIAVALIIFLTELNSNTATVATFSPILIIFAIGLEVNPLIFVIPTTIAASCAFMLPIATPPNAVVFGSGKVTINNMIRAGFMLNIISIFVVTAISLVILNQVFNFNLMTLPQWVIQN